MKLSNLVCTAVGALVLFSMVTVGAIWTVLFFVLFGGVQ